MTTTTISYSDLCALRARPADVDWFLHSAGLRREYATAEDLAWAEREAWEARLRDYLTSLGLLEWDNIEPLRA